MQFTNGLPIEGMIFHLYQSYKNILSPHNEMQFTNGIPIVRIPFHWSLFVSIGQPSLFGFTRLLHSQARPLFWIYRAFTESSQSTSLDLQGFYRVKSGPLFGFTGFLQSKIRPLFGFTRLLHSQARPPFWIYRVFTESSQATVLDLQGFYRVKPGLLGFTMFLQSQTRPPFFNYRVFTG